MNTTESFDTDLYSQLNSVEKARLNGFFHGLEMVKSMLTQLKEAEEKTHEQTKGPTP